MGRESDLVAESHRTVTVEWLNGRSADGVSSLCSEATCGEVSQR
jgi:hypothetical protein